MPGKDPFLSELNLKPVLTRTCKPFAELSAMAAGGLLLVGQPWGIRGLVYCHPGYSLSAGSEGTSRCSPLLRYTNALSRGRQAAEPYSLAYSDDLQLAHRFSWVDDKGGTKSLPMTEAFKSKREKDMDAAEGKKRDQSGKGYSGCWYCTVEDVFDEKGVEMVRLKVKSADPYGKPYPAAMVGKVVEFPNTDEKNKDGAYACLSDSSFPAEGLKQMTEIKYLNEAELSRNLELFMAHDKCYCECGATLVAINPFKNIKGNYDFGNSTAVKEAVAQGSVLDASKDPHVYLTSRKLYEKAVNEQKPQTLVITGESGAGKTWNTRKVLEYLAFAGKDPNAAPRLDVDGNPMREVTTRMLDSSNILDAFGNATMPRNDDSSRFGKLYQVFFDQGRVSGARIMPFLLEKSRVTHHSSRERNYHVFYMLVYGAKHHLSPAEYNNLMILEPTSYRYLNRFITDDDLATPDTCQGQNAATWYANRARRNGDVWLDPDQKNDTLLFENDSLYDAGEDETTRFRDLKGALEGAFGTARPGESPAETKARRDDMVSTVWKSTSAVLLFGQIHLAGEDTDVTISNPEVLNKVCELLDINPEMLAKNILKKKMTIRGQEKWFELRIDQARSNIHSIAATLYDWLFNWIVENVSEGLKENANYESPSRIGVLDIFGFECTAQDALNPPLLMNSFEQFCINLCNEQLQNKFQNDVMERERIEYKKELEIDFNPPFPDNTPTLQVCFKGGGPGRASKKGTIQGVLSSATEAGINSMSDQQKQDEDFLKTMCRDLKNFKVDRNNTKQSALSPKDDTLINAPLPNADPFIKRWSALHRKDKDKEWQKTAPRTFKMQHYAGEVYYDVYNWFSKNNAKLSDDVTEMLKQSQHCFPRDFVLSHSDSSEPYIMVNFTNDLDTMMRHLNSSECTFVRCIKSNTFKARGEFQGYLVLNQLRYTGMMDALRIRKMGWPFRMPQKASEGVHDWMDKYGVLYPHKTEHSTPQDFVNWLKQPGGTAAAQVIYQASFDNEDKQCMIPGTDLIMAGANKVFMKSDIAIKLDRAVDDALRKSRQIVVAQYQTKKAVATQLAPVIEGVIARRAFLEEYKSVYEKADRQETASLIKATIERQNYYELKRHYGQLGQNINVLQKFLEDKVIVEHEQYMKHIEQDAVAREQMLEDVVNGWNRKIEQAKAGDDPIMLQQQREVEQLKATIEARQAALQAAHDEQNAKRAAAQQELQADREKFAAIESEWQEKLAMARDELKEIEGQLPGVEAANSQELAAAANQHDHLVAQHKSELEAEKQKQLATMNITHKLQEDQEAAVHKAQAQAAAGAVTIQQLEQERKDMEARNILEVKQLANDLRQQNWKLAQLHMSEQKTAHEFAELGLALPSSQAQHAQGEQVDVLDAQIEVTTVRSGGNMNFLVQVLKRQMTSSCQQRDVLRSKLADLERTRSETEQAWQLTLQDQDNTINRIQEALEKEKKVSYKLEAACSQPGPPRASRFDVPASSAPPQTAPQTFTVNTTAPASTAVQYEHARSVREAEAKKADAAKQSGLSSLSALYQGHGTVHVSNLENLDTATLGAALRLLR